jgi:hypothetical protein
MATDMYGMFVRRNKAGEVSPISLEGVWDFDRSYPLFTMLCNIRRRNNYDIEPILDSPNGMPDWVVTDADLNPYNPTNEYATKLHIDIGGLGDYDFSHLDFDTILEYDISKMTVSDYEGEYLPLGELWSVQEFLGSIRLTKDKYPNDKLYMLFGFDA